MTLKDVVQETLKQGGCSYSFTYGSLHGLPFYVISQHKEREKIISLDEFNDNSVREYIKSNSDLLLEPSICLGTWVEVDGVYLDVITYYHKESITIEALQQLLKDNNQLSAYDTELHKLINKI